MARKINFLSIYLNFLSAGFLSDYSWPWPWVEDRYMKLVKNHPLDVFVPIVLAVPAPFLSIPMPGITSRPTPKGIGSVKKTSVDSLH